MFAYCENTPINAVDPNGQSINRNLNETDSGGGVIPPPIPTRTFDCEESAQAYYYHLKNTIESRSYSGKDINYSLEKVGAPYTINKATRMAEATYDNTNNAMISVAGGMLTGGKIGSAGGPVAAVLGAAIGGFIGWCGSQIYSYAKIQNSPLLPEGHYQSYKLTVCSFVGFAHTPCGAKACYCYTETYFAIGTADYNSRFCIPFGPAQTSYSYSYSYSSSYPYFYCP